MPALQPPTVLVEQINTDVQDLNLSMGISNNIDAKLQAARKALDDLNAKNDVAAVTSIHAFGHALEAQSGEGIDPDVAAKLIAAAEEILAQLTADLSSGIP